MMYRWLVIIFRLPQLQRDTTAGVLSFEIQAGTYMPAPITLNLVPGGPGWDGAWPMMNPNTDPDISASSDSILAGPVLCCWSHDIRTRAVAREDGETQNNQAPRVKDIA